MNVTRWAAYAEEFERKSRDFYSSCMRDAKDHDEKVLFSFLLRQENRHLQSIQGFLRGLEYDRSMIDPPMFNRLAKIRDDRMREKVNRALQFEKEGYEFYMSESLKEPDLAAKQFLKRLADDELKHSEVIGNCGRFLFLDE